MKVDVLSLRRLGRPALVAASVLLLGGAGPIVARVSAAPAAPKVVVIVGPAGPATASYRALAEQTAAAAEALTPNVVRVYSPDATWERVKAALQGASIVVYLGHGNGWPSIYHDALFPATEDGFGLNPEAGAADAHQYFGEDRIASEIHLAPNALVVFSHLCYASGLSEPDLPEGTLDQAQQRVDNYAAGFMKAGAGAVIADAYLPPMYYVTSALRGRGTIDAIWRGAPDRNGHLLTFASARTKGAIASMDPEAEDSGFVRSLVARPSLSAAAVLGGASRRPVEVEPAPEPSLIGLGLTFSSPGLSATPTAGKLVRLTLPMAREASRELPTGMMVATQWDRLDDGSDVPGAPRDASDPPSPDAGSPAPTAGSAAAAGDSPTADLVVPEVPGELVAPVAASRLTSGGLSVPVRMPATPGLYRLVSTLHDADGLAFDAATQALIPALIVRVVDPAAVAYRVASTARATISHPLDLSVRVTNLGTSAWGRAPDGRGAGPSELVFGVHATLVARWVPLGAPDLDASAADGGVDIPAGLGPGKSATVSLALIAPRVAGQYLVVLDLLDPNGASFAARGVAPAIVRVTVTS